jgi:hypothetical protein
VLSGAARGLLVSPWFAAGAGFVIATTAFIVAPRAELRFPNKPAINVTPCRQSACQSAVPQGALPLTGQSDQIRVPSPAPTLSLTFGYHVLWQQHGTFAMQITVPGKQAVGDWRLAFAIPGAVVTSVTGADWQRADTGVVTVRGSSSGSSRAVGDWGSVGGDGGSRYSGGQRDITLVVTARGSDTPPSGCVYDGSNCQFLWSS